MGQGENIWEQVEGVWGKVRTFGRKVRAFGRGGGVKGEDIGRLSKAK